MKKLKGRVHIGVDKDGRDIYKYVSAETPLELEMARAAVREHYIYGRPVPKDMCFAELAEEW